MHPHVAGAGFFRLPRRLRCIVKSATGGKWSKGGLKAWHILSPPHHLDRIMHIVLIGPTNHRWYLRTQPAQVALCSCSLQLISRSCITGWQGPQPDRLFDFARPAQAAKLGVFPSSLKLAYNQREQGRVVLWLQMRKISMRSSRVISSWVGMG